MWDGEGEPVEPSEHANLTEEDLAIDDTLSDEDRVATYATSQIELQRYVHVKMLSATARKIGFHASAEKFFPLLKSIARDAEYLVRQQLAVELEGLCKLCSDVQSVDEEENAYTVMLNELLPLLDDLLSDTVVEVRISAVNTLVKVAALIREGDMMEHVLSIMLRMAHDQESDEMRITAATLLNNLAATIGQELCHQFVIPEVISLSEDPVFRVRKAVSFNMEHVLKVAGEDVAENRLLPAFIRLSKDSIWGVRKACADALPGVSNQVPSRLRARYLVNIEESLAHDTSKWVRAAVMQRMGQFMSTLSRDMITDKMLDRYLTLANGAAKETPETPLQVNETERRRSNSMALSGDGNPLGYLNGPAPAQYQPIEYHMAYSFPAVVLTVGQSGWPRLKPLFFVLTQNSLVTVRRTMACSLHELAALLGEQISEEDLSLACDLFLSDEPQVCSGVLKNISRFLSYLSPLKRESYLPRMIDIRSSATHRTWRLRLLLADQLADLCELFSGKEAYTALSQLCFELLNDDVNAVSLAARDGVAHLLQNVKANAYLPLDSVLQMVLQMSKASRYDGRQKFVSLVARIFEMDYRRGGEHSKVLSKELRPPLFNLANDPVSNVRLLLAKELKADAFKSMEGLDELYAKLKDDNNIDVALAAGANLTIWKERHQEIGDGTDEF